MEPGVAARAIAGERLRLLMGGTEPFPWQSGLLDRFLAGTVPSALDLPTGLGKTSVMAIWLAARAAGADVPRRLVYVVDRRAVVDQATAVAVGLRERVEATPGLARDLGLDEGESLPISTLRGRFVDNRAWLADPSSPAIVLGTVDMVGSRLLFGGYGVSRRMRPYHAGLLGIDTLVVLDEAHLVPSFERMIESVAASDPETGRSRWIPNSEAAAELPRFRMLSLSATGRERKDAFRLSAADTAHPVVAQRLRATKALVVAPEATEKELATRLAEEAWALATKGDAAARILVYCDRRNDAEKVKEALSARARKEARDLDLELFVGARRIHEREAAAAWLAERGFLAGQRTTPKLPTVLVATSAAEVGIDLDADHLVSDLVAWERMIQRLGRVNRRGEGRARVVVVPRTREAADPETARDRAVRAVIDTLPLAGDGRDASPAALVALKERAVSDGVLAQNLAEAGSPAPLHPPLSRAVIETWSMTSLADHPGRPEVGPWLRGWIEDQAPETTIVWRDHLPVDVRGRLLPPSAVEAYLDTAAPHQAETLTTETYRVVEWLAARLSGLPEDEGDDTADASAPSALRQRDLAALVLSDSAPPRGIAASDLASAKQRDRLRNELAGTVLLVDGRVGGLKAGLLDPESPTAVDVTTLDRDRAVPFRLRRSRSVDEAVDAGWREELRLPIDATPDGEECAWLVIESVADQAAESEEGRSVGACRAQELDEHQSWTEAEAMRLATRLGLAERWAATLRLAARLHDEGKRSARWQRAFRAPDPSKTWGKTTSRPNLAVLGGYRHELGSLPRAERDPRVQELDEDARDLCLHLIAAHHGHARPTLSVDGADEPPLVLAGRVQDVALRFARLERRFGPFGLAWWEALLRAADQRASRRNDAGGDRG